MPNVTLQIPEVGHAVRVRNRLATVRAVEPYESRDAQGRLHIVEVEYLDDCRFPEAEQLLWEVEATAKVLGTTLLPGVNSKVMPLRIAAVEGDLTAKKEHDDRERSLLFVAATRARDQLIVTSWGTPSPFLHSCASPP
jgi:hypothetical protein